MTLLFLGIYKDYSRFSPTKFFNGNIKSVFSLVSELLYPKTGQKELFPPLSGKNFHSLKAEGIVPCAVDDLDFFANSLEVSLDALYPVGVDSDLSPAEFRVSVDGRLPYSKENYSGFDSHECVRPDDYAATSSSYEECFFDQYNVKQSPVGSDFSQCSNRKRKVDFDAVSTLSSSFSNSSTQFRYGSSVDSGMLVNNIAIATPQDSCVLETQSVAYTPFGDVDNLFDDFVHNLSTPTAVAVPHPHHSHPQPQPFCVGSANVQSQTQIHRHPQMFPRSQVHYEPLMISSFTPQVETHIQLPKKTKVEPSRFECPFCSAKFKVKGYLTRHMKKHNTLKAFQCPFYEDSSHAGSTGTKCHPTGGFSRRDTYKTHLKALHFIYPPGTKSADRNFASGRCAGCFRFFENNLQWLQEHIDAGACEGTVSSRKMLKQECDDTVGPNPDKAELGSKKVPSVKRFKGEPCLELQEEPHGVKRKAED